MHRFDELQNPGKAHFETLTASTSSLAKLWQTLADESACYSKASFGTGSAFLAKLAGVKTFEETLQIQSEYLKSSYGGLVGYLTKAGELYSSFAQEALKPVLTAASKAQE
ncbi:MAG TPA: phasin family protein [Methylocella sp.]|nr:phasin family protein [Methylocella sp.]